MRERPSPNNIPEKSRSTHDEEDGEDDDDDGVGKDEFVTGGRDGKVESDSSGKSLDFVLNQTGIPMKREVHKNIYIIIFLTCYPP